MGKKSEVKVLNNGGQSLGCKLMILLLLFTHLAFAGERAFSQQNITVQFNKQSLSEVLRVLKQKTSYEFLYNDEEVSGITGITASFTNASLQEILTKCLSGTKYNFKIVDNLIVITPDEKKDEVKKMILKGKVVGEKGEVLPGVTVLLKKTTIGVSTDIDGKFKLELPKQDSLILVFSFIGMKTYELNVSKIKDLDKELIVKMESDSEDLDEVVVTGYANIKKESFTGSSISVKREDLLKASSTNVIQALSSFDPSFRIQQSNKWGSDPNAIPEIYIRGRSGIGVKELDKDALSKSSLKNNPNLPIFIMDGFEVSVQKVYDMDPMRIENVQILKDASATAMYGSRAANGVVVITTVAPKPGEVTISYSLTGTLSVPDLSDYNLADAKEKLEIEQKAGLYTLEYYTSWEQALDAYNERLLRVQEGVTTDWLSMPLRNALNHKHSLSIEGGNADLRYGLDLSYNNNNGVMKDSYRNTLNLGFHIDYRLKNLQVVNYIEYNYTKAQESPYGDFSDYAHLQPYDRPYDKNGNLISGLLEFSTKTHKEAKVNNPLYEARLKNYEYDKGDVFIDRIMAQWFLTDYLHLKGQFAVTKEFTKKERFIDPLSSNSTSKDQGEDAELAGDLYLTKGEGTNWDAQVGVYLSKAFGGHALNVSAVMNATSRQSESTSSHYRGFPSGEYHSPNYAAEIKEKPSKTQRSSRLAGFLLLANYTWNDIYLADVSVRFDGSSEFGLDQKWAPFWSFGAGLNMHNYKFLQNNKIINRLKLRASYGQTGKVNFPSYSARTVYQTFDRWYIGGFGVSLKALGNRDLKWETTNKLNIGTDLEFWNSRISLVFDYYYNKTVDLITDVTLPGSAGFTSYKSNLGETLNKGFDIQFRLDVVKNKEWNVALWGNLNHNRNEILKISDALKAYNSQVEDFYALAEESSTPTTDWTDANKTYEDFIKPIMKYEEGASLTAIYGVRSLGIDPTNGKELYLYRNGKVSNVWKATEEVVLGDTEPEASGSFGLNLTYKNFSLFASFGYEWGMQTYNETLVSNVENADIRGSNVDKRVLTQRWEKPGDIAPLKDIKNMDNVTLPTSRFVQDENTLSLDALTVSYDFDPVWLRKIFLKTLRLEVSTNELFRLSTVKQERGTSYPFARTVNFSLRATF